MPGGAEMPSAPTSGPHMATQWPNPPRNPVASAIGSEASTTDRYSAAWNGKRARVSPPPGTRTTTSASQSRRPLVQRRSAPLPA